MSFAVKLKAYLNTHIHTFSADVIIICLLLKRTCMFYTHTFSADVVSTGLHKSLLTTFQEKQKTVFLKTKIILIIYTKYILRLIK